MLPPPNGVFSLSAGRVARNCGEAWCIEQGA